MKSVFTKRLLGSVMFVSAVAGAAPAYAQLAVGTWARTDAQGIGLTMTIEMCCNGGRRLIYHIPPVSGQPAVKMSVDSPMDGSEVPVLVDGKPSGQTMAIKRVDDRHVTAVMKVNGQPFGTSSSTLSADGKTLTVETTMQVGASSQKNTETWVKK